MLKFFKKAFCRDEPVVADPNLKRRLVTVFAFEHPAQVDLEKIEEANFVRLPRSEGSPAIWAAQIGDRVVCVREDNRDWAYWSSKSVSWDQNNNNDNKD